MLSRPHICGIGGIGTSGVALLLCDLGIPVTGSDLRASELTQMLVQRGAEISYVTDLERVKRASCVIVPTVFPKNHPELEMARAQGIPVIERTEALAWICRQYVKDLTIVFGTQERAQVARGLAVDKGWGYCTGMATRDGLPHARFESSMVIDLDERTFHAFEHLYAAFPGARVVISDWVEDDYGYYPAGFSKDVFLKNLTPHVASVESSVPSASVVQGIGWFEPVKVGHYHEIRMHPVNVASSLKKLRQISGEASVGVVLRPFVSTLLGYESSIWSKVLGMADRLWVISPPYEGCSTQDCVEFVHKLCDSGCSASLCSLEEAWEIAGVCPFGLWVGAPDIVSGL